MWFPVPMPAESQTKFRKSAEMFAAMGKDSRIPETRKRMNSMLARYFLGYNPEKVPPVRLKEIDSHEKAEISQSLRNAKNVFKQEAEKAQPEILDLDKKARRFGNLALGAFLGGLAAFVASVALAQQAVMGAHIPFFSNALKNIWAATAAVLGPLVVAISASAALATRGLRHDAKSDFIKNEIKYAKTFLEHLGAHLDALRKF